MTKSWDDFKETIIQLYIGENKPLEEVKNKMLSHGFDASTRAYRNRFRKWKVRKNNRHGERMLPTAARNNTSFHWPTQHYTLMGMSPVAPLSPTTPYAAMFRSQSTSGSLHPAARTDVTHMPTPMATSNSGSSYDSRPSDKTSSDGNYTYSSGLFAMSGAQNTPQRDQMFGVVPSEMVIDNNSEFQDICRSGLYFSNETSTGQAVQQNSQHYPRQYYGQHYASSAAQRNKRRNSLSKAKPMQLLSAPFSPVVQPSTDADNPKFYPGERVDAGRGNSHSSGNRNSHHHIPSSQHFFNQMVPQEHHQESTVKNQYGLLPDRQQASYTFSPAAASVVPSRREQCGQQQNLVQPRPSQQLRTTPLQQHLASSGQAMGEAASLMTTPRLPMAVSLGASAASSATLTAPSHPNHAPYYGFPTGSGIMGTPSSQQRSQQTPQQSRHPTYSSLFPS